MPEPKELPIRQYADDIVASCKQNDIVVVIGETGSGKTTQLSQARHCMALAIQAPCALAHALLAALQILYEAGLAGHGIIGVTQPRRVVRWPAWRAILLGWGGGVAGGGTGVKAAGRHVAGRRPRCAL